VQAACLDGGYAQFSFETFEREPVQGGMWADGRAKGFQTGGQIVLRRCSRRILLEGNQLAFETAEEMFSHGVVAGIVPVGYVLRHTVRLGVGTAKAPVFWARGGDAPCPKPPASTVWAMRSRTASPTIFLLHGFFTIAGYRQSPLVGMQVMPLIRIRGCSYKTSATRAK